jgi:hypothetical protein
MITLFGVDVSRAAKQEASSLQARARHVLRSGAEFTPSSVFVAFSALLSFAARLEPIESVPTARHSLVDDEGQRETEI